jgi:signal peptidase I
VILVFFPLVIFALVVRIFLFEPFYIPSGAMVPTLLVGDYLFASKFPYGYGRYSLPLGLPLFSGRIFEFGHPQRGDVALFRLPADSSTVYVKRIVGLPGDTIQMIRGNLYINGQVMPRRPIEDCIYREQGAALPMHQYVETLPRPDGPPLEHRIIKIGDDGPLDNTAVYQVPPGNYFAIGDNRDNSRDSRTIDFGFIPVANFVGRAEFLFYSTSGLTIRYGRLFRGVQAEGSPSHKQPGDSCQ